jgi:putative SOS response-associated peptidase YedK
MCGRYSLICIDDLGNRFRVFNPMIGARSRFNIAPGNEMPVIVREGRNHATVMRWGLIPSWTRDIRSARPMINARAESLAKKPAFRGLLASCRCLVPASGFYEWKKEGKRRSPYYFRLPGEPVFAFAGLWDRWHNPGGVTVSTYTIVTCAANPLVAPVHDRMPVILSREAEERWLAPGPLNSGELAKVLVPYPSGCMEAFPVADLVNNPAADDERLIRPQVSSAGQTHLT